MKIRTVFFEPWGLGDTLVAAAVVREVPEAPALACKQRWHSILRAILPESVSLIPVELPYTLHDKKSSWRRGELPAIDTGPCEVLSIRGDFRDWLSAKDLFPLGRMRVNGWVQFAPHYSRLLDLPFATGMFKIRNRYRAWAKLARIPFRQLEQTYRTLQHKAPLTGDIVIHIGAYRRSRQYPHVQALRTLLGSRGYSTRLVSGPNDALPQGISEAGVSRVLNQELVHALHAAKLVITNDSGPMHLGALLGCRTIAIARVTNIAEWLPPATRFVASAAMPKGYRMDSRYNSDDLLEGWPSPEEIARTLDIG